MRGTFRNGCAAFLGWSILTGLVCAQTKLQARDLGVPFDGATGPLNAITDVKGVEVGHTTLISGASASKAGVGPVRTGVTADASSRQRLERSGLHWMVH